MTLLIRVRTQLTALEDDRAIDLAQQVMQFVKERIS
jgi:hypothetical protein